MTSIPMEINFQWHCSVAEFGVKDLADEHSRPSWYGLN